MNKVIPFLSIALAAIPVGLGAFSPAVFAQSTDSSAQVFVNRQQVDFQGQPPIEQNGHLLVPLRGVLEKLGAYVDYNSNTQTVVARRGDTRIVLPIGRRNASVNGQSVPLEVPAQVVNGSTLVPLRFVAESLGAYVNYDVSRNTVAINLRSGNDVSTTGSSVLPGDRGGAPWRHRPRGNDTSVTGTVTAVYADTDPAKIAIRTSDGQDKTIALRSDAPTTFQRPGAAEEKIPLDRIEVGSTVAILVNDHNFASAVNVTSPARRQPAPPPVAREFRGEFQESSRRDNDVFVLKTTNGQRIEVPKGIPVFLDSQRINLDDLRSGDKLTIAVDPRTHMGTRIIVAPNR